MSPKEYNPEKERLALIHSIMRNPKLSRTIFEGASSAVGSTKRAQSKAMLSIVNKMSPAGGGKYNGQGGPGDVSNPYGLTVPAYQQPQAGSSFSTSGSGTMSMVPNIATNVPSRVTIFPSLPPLKSTNVGPSVGSSISSAFKGLSLNMPPAANKPINTSSISSNSNISKAGGMSTPGGTIGSNPFAMAHSLASGNSSGGDQGGYTVKAGDTLQSIYGDDWKNVSGYSGDPTKLQVGQTLKAPPGQQSYDTTHTVKTSADGSTTKTISQKPVTQGTSESNFTNNWGRGTVDYSSTPGSTQTGSQTGSSTGGSNPTMNAGTPTGAVVQNIASMLKIPDPKMSLADVIAQVPGGANAVAEAMVRHENSQLDPSLNNPGDIKFANLPGQIDSGVASTDGGNWAKYPTLAAGQQAVTDIVNKYANSGSTFDYFVNKYTGNPTDGSSSSSTGGYQAPTLEDAQKQIPYWVQQGLGSEAFASQYAGAIASGQVQNTENILAQKSNLDAILAKKTQLAQENPTVVQDMTDYVKGKDTYLAQINSMIDNVRNAMATTDTSNPNTYKMYTDYMNYLVNLKGSQMKTYGDYLNRSIAQYNNDVSAVDTQYNNALNTYNAAVKDSSTLTKGNYDEIKKTLVDMYDSYLDTPGKLSAMNKANDELNSSSLDTVNSITGYKNDLLTEQNKYSDMIVNSSKNPNTNQTSIEVRNDINLPAVMKNLAVDQKYNPQGILKLFTDGAISKLKSYQGSVDPTTKTVTGTKPEMLRDTLAFEQQIEDAIAVLPPLAQQQMQPYVNDAKKSLIASVETGMNNYILEHYNDVNDAVNQLSGVKAHWWSGTPTVTSLAQWQKDNPKVDRDVLEAIWTTTQMEKQTYKAAGQDFNLMDGLKAASLPNTTAGGKTLYGLPANEQLAWYLSAQITEPYKYMIANGDSFSGSSLSTVAPATQNSGSTLPWISTSRPPGVN